MDLQMEAVDSIAATREIRARLERSGSRADLVRRRRRVRALEAGASGYLLKDGRRQGRSGRPRSPSRQAQLDAAIARLMAALGPHRVASPRS
jgi:DNA-binding NarL/FixJ family response regulator